MVVHFLNSILSSQWVYLFLYSAVFAGSFGNVFLWFWISQSGFLIFGPFYLFPKSCWLHSVSSQRWWRHTLVEACSSHLWSTYKKCKNGQYHDKTLQNIIETFHYYTHDFYKTTYQLDFDVESVARPEMISKVHIKPNPRKSFV